MLGFKLLVHEKKGQGLGLSEIIFLVSHGVNIPKGTTKNDLGFMIETYISSHPEAMKDAQRRLVVTTETFEGYLESRWESPEQGWNDEESSLEIDEDF